MHSCGSFVVLCTKIFVFKNTFHFTKTFIYEGSNKAMFT